MSLLSSKEGVYYQKNAHLGVWSRFAICLIDLAVVGVISVILAVVLFVLLPEPTAEAASGLAVFFFVIVYFVILKRTAFRTVGYRTFHVRVVNLFGERPSLFQMVNRFSFILLGPLNGLTDLLWVSSEESKQALRDKWSKTYVVKENAEPVGHGPISMQRYGIMGFNFLFAEVFEGKVGAP